MSQSELASAAGGISNASDSSSNGGNSSASPSSGDKRTVQRSASVAFDDDGVFKIYLMDETIRQVKFSSGRNTKASDILSAVLRLMKVEDAQHNLFALWMIGDALQLQLKPSHMPSGLKDQWSQMMNKFCGESPTETPKLVLKRDAFVLKATERKIRDTAALELLFDEARYNVIYSKYPTTVDDAIYLGALLAQIFYLETPTTPVTDIFTNLLHRVVPKELINKLKATEWQERLTKAHANHASRSEHNILYLLYLQYVWQWPFYGSTFFMGEYTPKAKGIVLRERANVLVRVGVNSEYITVINEATNAVEFKFEFQEISWDSLNENGRTFFIIEYGPTEAPEELVIETPMASLVDSMVTRAVEESKKREDAILQLRKSQGGPDDLPVESIETGLTHDARSKPKFRSLKKIFL